MRCGGINSVRNERAGLEPQIAPAAILHTVKETDPDCFSERNMAEKPDTAEDIACLTKGRTSFHAARLQFQPHLHVASTSTT